jgi:hypothetical protein
VNKPRDQKKYALHDVFSVTEIPTDESCTDLEAFIQGSSNHILEAIDCATQAKRYVFPLIILTIFAG